MVPAVDDLQSSAKHVEGTIAGENKLQGQYWWKCDIVRQKEQQHQELCEVSLLPRLLRLPGGSGAANGSQVTA